MKAISKLVNDLKKAFAAPPITRIVASGMQITGKTEQDVRNIYAEAICDPEYLLRYYAKYARLPNETEQRVMQRYGFSLLDDLIVRIKPIDHETNQ